MTHNFNPKKKSLIFLLMVIIFCQLNTNCQADTKQNQNIQQQVLDENFDTFYKKFYSDSLFQISRITFPMKGINSDEYDPDLGDKNPPYFWKKKDWNFLHTLDQNIVKDKHEYGVDVYKKVIKHNTNSFVVEKIYREESGYSEERWFKKANGKWFLIYYSFKDF